MVFCPNCGTQYESLPLRCQCGYLFGSGPAAQTAPVAPSPEARFAFTGDGAELFKLYVQLILFSIPTLGIYSFWGRTEIRSYLWGSVQFAGQPFFYHGTGKELFLGWLKFFGGLIVLYAGVGWAAIAMGERGSLLAAAILYGTIFLLMPLAIHGALRYRLSRTSWNGRRFSYRGNLWKLALSFWIGALMTVVTLGLALPYFLADLRGYVVENIWFAGQRFDFSGRGKDLFWPFALHLLLYLPTLSLARFWYAAKQTEYYWARTSFASVPFRSTISVSELTLVKITNLLLTVFTFGIGYPWAICRQMRYLTANLSLDRLPAVTLTAGDDAAGTAFGDELGLALGTDAGIDAGFGL
ncbi:YjgN family protein [Bryobacter aggregatus]|uniref:YjgN family protein n=1 Tax=Bryobacter aggregatus TaxID=360054 RepID=UPI0009B5A6C7|nr:DUF898 family protein [Bryobacter aggregatus]